MSWTDEPPGSRPICHACGEHRWARVGYCLSVKCAGPLKHHDYPQSAPEEYKWNRSREKVITRPSKKKPPKPPKKGRRALELQYEARGEKAPWLTDQDLGGS